MNKQFWMAKLWHGFNAKVICVLVIALAIATTSAWAVTHAQSDDQTVSPTPLATGLVTDKVFVYLPLVQNSTDVQASAVLPPDVPRLGLIFAGLEADSSGACRGLWRVTKTNRCTHGPDLPPPGINIQKENTPLTTARLASITAAVCNGDGVSGNRVQIMYVRASDRADRYNQYLSSFRQWASDMDQMYYDSAVETGGARRVRFVHDANCVPTVLNVVLSPSGDDDFSNTLNELAALGYNHTDRKYVMFMDAHVYCGIGSLWGDDKFAQNNANNAGPSYSRADNGCWNGYTIAHELNHNLGGIQLSAPHTSGGYHCVDEYDLMCYSDTPNHPTMQYLCPDSAHELRLDCHHDDYYHTNPVAGSYLATHWNTANNQFLIANNLPTATPTWTPTATATQEPGCLVYNSSNVPLAIADLTTIESTLAVPSNFTLTDVNLRNLQILHTYDADLRAILVSPTGIQVELFNGVGGSDDNFTDTFLDDAATTSIASGVAPFNARYRPSGLLNTLNGQNSAGTWRLRITDIANGDTGALNAWSLELCSNSASTPTPTKTNTPVPPTVTKTGTPTKTPVPPTVTKTSTPTKTPKPPTRTPSPARIAINLDTQPDSSTDIKFTGDLASFKLDDANPNDNDAYTHTKAFTVAPDVYNVAQTVPSKSSLSSITCIPANKGAVNLANKQVTITALAGDNITCTFVDQPSFTLRAYKYNDSDKNGRRNSESYLADWTMTVYNAANSPINAQATDSLGKTSFTLAVGQYTICETQKSGWANSQPGVSHPIFHQPCYSVTPQAGQTVSVYFGNYQGVAGAALIDATAATAEGVVISSEEEVANDAANDPADTDDPSAALTNKLYLPLITSEP